MTGIKLKGYITYIKSLGNPGASVSDLPYINNLAKVTYKSEGSSSQPPKNLMRLFTVGTMKRS